MSGGSDFDTKKLEILYGLDDLRRKTNNPDTQDDIERIKRMIAALMEF